jgi:hypothetical protein
LCTQRYRDLWLSSDKNPSLFEDAREFEPILRRKDQPYRDHFIYAHNVFLLGYYIINKLNEITSNNNYFGKNSNDSNLTWMLASTFHDVAYPVQETEEWLNDLFDKFLGVNPKLSFNIAQIMPTIYVDFMRMLSYYHKDPKQPFLNKSDFLDMDWIFLNDLGSKLIEKDHGVLGALMLCHRMAIREKFLAQKSDNRARNPWDFFYNHMPACHAICVHTLNEVKIAFHKHPFAFLLILCDELQDWGRPSNKDNKDNINLLDISVEICDQLSKIQILIDASPVRRNRLNEILDKRLEKSQIKIEIIQRDRGLSQH